MHVATLFVCLESFLHKPLRNLRGKDTIQIHKDALNENDVVLLHDDLLATGGTMEAACKLVQKMNPKKIYVNFIIELKELHGIDLFNKDVDVQSVLSL